MPFNPNAKSFKETRSSTPAAKIRVLAASQATHVRRRQGSQRDGQNSKFRAKLQPRMQLVSLDTPDTQRGVRAPEIKCTLNSTNFFRVINAIAQAAVVVYGPVVANDTAATDITNFVQFIFNDLQVAMTGGIPTYTECPMFYRELWEALRPATSGGAWQANYSFDETTLPNTFTTTDGVQWGSVNSAGTTLNGLYPVNAFNPAASDNALLASANLVFQRFRMAGHTMWKQGAPPTIFNNDVSVFSWPTVDTQPDFANGSGTMSSEVPILHTWLAALQLVSPVNISNRIANYTLPFYAPPNGYMGYRINSYNLGRRGSRDQVRFQWVDISELMILVNGVMGGANLASLSTTVSVGQPFSPTGYNDLLEIFMRAICAVAFFNESPVTVGSQDPYGNFATIPFGTQFFLPSPSTTSTWQMFEIVIENIRRLKYVGQKYRGVPTYIFNVLGASNNDLAYKVFTAEALPGTFNFNTMFNSANSTFYNYDVNGVGSNTATTLSGFVQQWKSLQSYAQNFSKYSHGSSQVEKAPDGLKTPVQQVTWFARAIGPGVGKFYNEENQTYQRLHFEWQHNILSTKRPNGPFVKDGSVDEPRMFSLAGTYAAIVMRRPYKDEQNVYMTLVLPLVYVDPNQSSTSNSLALPMSRHMGTAYIPANSPSGIYYDALLLTGQSMTRAITQAAQVNELMTTFARNDDLGLGGALGTLFNWISGKLAAKHPKTAKALGFAGKTLDNVLGMTRFGGLNNEIGMMIPTGKKPVVTSQALVRR